MLGELEISPEVSEETEAEGETGGMSSWRLVETGVVLRSQEAAPVRRFLEGGTLALALAPGLLAWWPAGERACFEPSWSEMSSEAMDESEDPEDSAIFESRDRGSRERWDRRGCRDGRRRGEVDEVYSVT